MQEEFMRVEKSEVKYQGGKKHSTRRGGRGRAMQKKENKQEFDDGERKWAVFLGERENYNDHFQEASHGISICRGVFVGV